ncbi:MAG: hypothetical protein ABUT20_29525 [Bacteroidota bacterium]
MRKIKLKAGDNVVLKANWIIIYKLIKITKDGINAICMNFRGEEKMIPLFNLEKYYLPA